MANILEKINVIDGKRLWNEVNSNQELANFHRKGFVAKYTWDDVYNVIAYERSLEMENFISAMMATNLVKMKLRQSYLTSADVFVGRLEDRIQDVYNEIYLMFWKKIPAWDMSFGVYLDTYLSKDIDTVVKNTANFSVYGTGTGQDGPGAAYSLNDTDTSSLQLAEISSATNSTKSENNQLAETVKSMLTNEDGEYFEEVERGIDTCRGSYAMASVAAELEIAPETLQAVAFTHKFKVRLSPAMHRDASEAMKDFMNERLERVS